MDPLNLHVGEANCDVLQISVQLKYCSGGMYKELHGNCMTSSEPQVVLFPWCSLYKKLLQYIVLYSQNNVSNRTKLQYSINICIVSMCCKVKQIMMSISPFSLSLAESYVGKGTYLRRIRYHGRGQFGTMHKYYSHYFLRLREGPPPPKKKRKKEDHKSFLTRKLIQAGPRSIPNSL